MFESQFFLWLGMIFPLVFSAGPANVTMASLGGRFGLFKCIPFILGINFVVLLQALIIGFGAGIFIEKYPVVFKYLQYVGALYLMYLAYRLFNVSPFGIKNSSMTVPRFIDGFILQCLNTKVMSVIVVMFSQFLDKSGNQIVQISMLSFGIASLTTAATISWNIGGMWLAQKFVSKKSVKLQGYILGSMLLGVAIWMILLIK